MNRQVCTCGKQRRVEPTQFEDVRYITEERANREEEMRQTKVTWPRIVHYSTQEQSKNAINDGGALSMSRKGGPGGQR